MPADEPDERKYAPMRVQLKVDDGTEQGVWLTMFEGWAEMGPTLRATEEAVSLANAIQQQSEDA